MNYKLITSKGLVIDGQPVPAGVPLGTLSTVEGSILDDERVIRGLQNGAVKVEPIKPDTDEHESSNVTEADPVER